MEMELEALHEALLAGNSTVSWADLQAALRSCRDCDAVGLQAAAAPTERVSLQSCELWQQFHDITNEMIITKAGRRMFPLLQVKLSGLQPTANYCILLEFQPTHNHRWRFLNGKWQNSSTAAAEASGSGRRSVYLHPSSPATGTQWMKELISFAKVKLSNKENGNGKIKLNSLYKYQPCVYIVRLPPSELDGPTTQDHHLHITSHPFPETQFIAVTAYQNDKITQMKIKHNPFAKAFLGSHDREELSHSEDTGDQLEQAATPASVAPSITVSHSLTPPVAIRLDCRHAADALSPGVPPATYTVPDLPVLQTQSQPVSFQQVTTATNYIPGYETNVHHHHHPSYSYPHPYTTASRHTPAPTPLCHYTPNSTTFQPSSYWPGSQPTPAATAHPMALRPTYYPHLPTSYVTPLGYHN